MTGSRIRLSALVALALVILLIVTTQATKQVFSLGIEPSSILSILSTPSSVPSHKVITLGQLKKDIQRDPVPVTGKTRDLRPPRIKDHDAVHSH